MCIIEPGRFYLELRSELDDYKKIFKPLLEQYKNIIQKVIIEMLSFDFNITNEIPCSITYIDKSNMPNVAIILIRSEMMAPAHIRRDCLEKKPEFLIL